MCVSLDMSAMAGTALVRGGGGRGIEVERGQGREEVGKRERGKEHIEGKRAKGGGGGGGREPQV